MVKRGLYFGVGAQGASVEGTLPLVTVGVTCFNASETIECAIASALAQDWPNVEVVLVDDHSTDDSVTKAKRLLNGKHHVRVIEHATNRGYPAALNTIVENSTGEYVAFFDDDDESEPNRITAQVSRIQDCIQKWQTSKVVCYTNRRVFIDGKESSAGFVRAIGRVPPEPMGDIVADYLLWNYTDEKHSWGEFGSCTLMAKTSLLKEFSFDESFRRSAEWDFAIRLALASGYFVAVDDPLVKQHKTPTADKAGATPLRYALQLRSKHKKYLKRRSLYWAAKFYAYGRFNLYRGNLGLGRLFAFLAGVSAPRRILMPAIRKRLRAVSTMARR